MSQQIIPVQYKLIGLTGGIASGKSTVSDYLKSKGAYIIDADQIARDIVQVGQMAWYQIKEKWGSQVLQDDGQLNRKKLGTLVFNDPKVRKALEKITHPCIVQESALRIQNALQRAQKGLQDTLVVYDAALLIESGRYEQFRPIVLVSCSVESQIQRIKQRDGLTHQHAVQRLQAQMSLQDKLPFADYVIKNDQTLAVLSQQIDQIWQEILS
jgi:dephospho-CoA kinase